MPAGTTPWTVVHLSADDSPAMRNATTLVGWLARQPDVDLHTVLWLPGWSDTSRFARGRFHDVARDHRRLLPRLARRLGRERRAGALTARAARANLASIPSDGVVFLDGAPCAVALRYLPPGDRFVVTLVLASDRDADPLPPERLEQLLTETSLWLAEDEATRDWAARTWGIDPGAVGIVGDLLDLEDWDERHPPVDRDRLALAVAGAPWFNADHTARLVQCLLARRPSLDLELLWVEVERREHLAPLLHDLHTVGVADRLVLPASHEEVHDRLGAAHVLALTSPDHDAPWLAWEAARKGLPVVCADVHERAPEVGDAVSGRVVAYLDLPAMADAVLALVDEQRRPATLDHEAARSARADRDVAALARRIRDDAEGART